MNKSFHDKLQNLLQSEFPDADEHLISENIEHLVECLDQETIFLDIPSLKKWLHDIKANLPADVYPIPLKDAKGGWDFDEQSGNYQHETGGFFKIIGVRTETNIRESGKGWDQPMLDQGTESSVAGLIKKKFHDTYYYLIEAKFEPGNFDKVLFSPTLQVTFDNLNKLHSGRKPLFAEYFDGTNSSVKVIYQHWYPEDGGRFYLKRVKNMLVEINDEIEIPAGFQWMTMYQLKMLLKEDNLINQHLRSIISYL
jgi:oxidase EvaA